MVEITVAIEEQPNRFVTEMKKDTTADECSLTYYLPSRI